MVETTQTTKGVTAREAGPSLDSLSWIREDGGRKKIHPADVRGRYQRRKNWVWAALVAIYLVTPWIEIAGRPMILIDIEHRDFFLFGTTFNAQDFYLAFFLLSGIGITLFVVSALFGRVWCGYACPHTVFLEGVFRRVERWIEGTAHNRRKLDDAVWDRRKVVARVTKWGLYLVISLVLSHTLLGYFMPIEEVISATTHSPAERPTAFLFVFVLTLIIYANFAWFREQMCIVLCPYGRLQGVLYDKDTVQVGYDRQRGEPRGKARRGSAGSADPAGDCIDCFRCVAVCPTGIDIRNGTQLECVGCYNCVDACDEVMLKVGKPAGLVGYDSLAGFEGKKRRMLRPRMFFYAVLLVVGASVFWWAGSSRTDYAFDLTHQTGAAFTRTEDGGVRNGYFLQLFNKRDEPVQFVVDPLGPAGADVIPPRIDMVIPARSDRRIPVFVTVPEANFDEALYAEFRVWSEHMEEDQVVSARLLGPNRAAGRRSRVQPRGLPSHGKK